MDVCRWRTFQMNTCSKYLFAPSYNEQFFKRFFSTKNHRDRSCKFTKYDLYVKIKEWSIARLLAVLCLENVHLFKLQTLTRKCRCHRFENLGDVVHNIIPNFNNIVKIPFVRRSIFFGFCYIFLDNLFNILLRIPKTNIYIFHLLYQVVYYENLGLLFYYLI